MSSGTTCCSLWHGSRYVCPLRCGGVVLCCLCLGLVAWFIGVDILKRISDLAFRRSAGMAACCTEYPVGTVGLRPDRSRVPIWIT